MARTRPPYVKDQARIDAARMKLRSALAKPADPNDNGSDLPLLPPHPVAADDVIAQVIV